MLTLKQRRFCEEYIVDLNATKAAERAKFSGKTAGVQGWQLLQKPEVQDRITELNQARSKRVELNADEVLVRLDHIGDLDPLSCYDDNDQFKRLKDIPIEVRKCIKSIEVFEEWDGVGRDRTKAGEIRKITYWDKIRANELIGKHRKLFVDKVDHTHRVGTLEDLVGGSNENDPNKQIEGKGEKT